VTRADLEKLLGAYAAGTLTPEERRVLFEAALTDQALFDMLADEEVLRDTLADPVCRERVRLALVGQPPTVFESLDLWMRRHPVWALATALTTAVLIFVVVAQTGAFRPPPPASRQVAMNRKPALPSLAVPAQPQKPAPPQRAIRPPKPTAAPSVVNSAPRAAAPLPQLAERERGFAAPPAVRPKPAAPAGALASGIQPQERSREQLIAQAPPPPPPPPSAAAGGSVGAATSAAASAPSRFAASAEMAKARNAVADRAARAVQAKEAFEGKVKGETALGLRYTLVRRLPGDKTADVPPDTAFASGEPVTLRVEVDRSGYLYVLAGDQALFTGPVTPEQPAWIEAEPGTLHLVLLPEPDNGPISTLVRRTRRRLAGTLVRVERPEDRRTGDDSVYVVSPTHAREAGILTDILIRSR
jgi:hypothetical protein